MAIDPLAFRRAMATFATGVCVITVRRRDGGCSGITVNSLCSVSLEPPLVLWCLRSGTWRYAHFHSASRFNVNILAADQHWLLKRFAGRDAELFSDVPHRFSNAGPPLIAGCAAHLECRRRAVYPGGDHAIMIGEVEALAVSDRTGLVFHNGRFLPDSDDIPWLGRRDGDCAADVLDFW